MILELLSEILTEAQHTITAVCDASKALDYISTNTYDCILCDLKMPGMSGRELFNRILEVQPDLTRRLIFITGDFLSDETEAFIQESKIPLIKKPFVVEEAYSLVNEVLSHRPA
jgi:CheY-like chemotaxis protein